MHPLETKAPKAGGKTIEEIERTTAETWISMDTWNKLRSLERHTAEHARFSYLEKFGGWIKVRIA